MTHDLVERLRDYGLTLEESVVICDRRVVDEAADLIESLRADLAEQKAAHGDCIKRNIALTAEIAALRAEKDELRKAVIEEAARVADAEAEGRRWQKSDANAHNDKRAARDFETMMMEAVQIASAIRNMGERE